MARTNRQTRAYIAEIVSIKQQVDALNARKRVIAAKLGYGSWRSRMLPGMLVLIKRGSGGWRVQWKEVAADFAKRLGLSDKEVTLATYGHRTMTHAHPTVCVQKDKAKLSNPDLRVA